MTAIAPTKRPTPRSLPRLARSQLITLTPLPRADGAAAEDERFAIAISSEYPVERWFGIEILDHGKGSVDLKRLRDGGALLVDHDTRDHVGVVEEVAVDEDRVLRGVIRFGNAARAREIRQDVLDGIRKHISVGYRVLKMKTESADEKGPETYRVTRWEPLEVSIVAVPADPSVGLGRSGEDGALQLDLDEDAVAPAPDKAAHQERSMPEPEKPAAPDGAPTDVAQIRVTERGEAAEIARLCAENGVQDRTEEYLKAGKSPGEVGLLILADKRKAAADTHVDSASPTWEQLTQTEKDRFQLTRAIMAAADGDWQHAGFERAVSDAEAKRLGRSTDKHRVLIPSGLSLMPRQTRTTLVAGTASLGGNVVFTEAGSFIELLRNKMVCAQAGATILTGLTAPVAFPNQLTAATLYWPGEAPGTDVTASNQTFGQMKLTGLAGQAQVAYSRQLLVQSSPSIDDLVRRDLALIHAIGLDAVALKGTGTLQPTGVLNYTNVGSVTIGANAGAPTYAKIVEVETTAAVANADVGALKWVTNPKVRGKLRQLEQFASTNGMPVWERDGSMLGYPALVTNQVPSNLTKGTSTTICSAVIFGNWTDLVIGEFGAFEILADPLTLAAQGLIRLVTYHLVDVGIRHAASFTAIQDVLTT